MLIRDNNPVGGGIGALSILALPVIVTALLLSASVFGQSPPIEKCKVKGKTGKYELISEAMSGTVSKNDPTDDVVLVFIRLDQKKFTRENMRLVADRISRTYCKTTKLQAVFFENEESLSKYLSPGFPLSLLDEIVRGYYSFDREKETEELEFSTKLGNPTTEVKLDLGNP